MRPALMALLPLPALVLASCGSVSNGADAMPIVAPDSGPPDAISGLPDVVGLADAPLTTPDATPIPDAPPGTPDATPCIHCAELAMGGDFMMGCPASIDLYTAVIDCLCLPTNCGDVECVNECSGMPAPDPMPCQDCVNMVVVPGGACQMQADACFSDM